MRYMLREGGQKAFSTLSLTPFFVRSLSPSHFLCLALDEVRGVTAARKINNYEARGDDSNAEIKVFSNKIIPRVLYMIQLLHPLFSVCRCTDFCLLFLLYTFCRLIVSRLLRTNVLFLFYYSLNYYSIIQHSIESSSNTLRLSIATVDKNKPRFVPC